MSILKRYEIRPGVVLKLTEQDYARITGQPVAVQAKPEPPPDRTVRFEIEPGIILNLTPEDAQKVREERDRRRAEQAAAALKKPAVGPTLPAECGVVLLGESETAAARIAEMGLPCQVGSLSLPYEFNLLWEPSAPLRLDLIPAGFHLISRFPWQVAVPLWSYDQLARDIGTPEERDLTERIIRDLRVPAYDCRVLFLRRCLESQDLLDIWWSEQAVGEDKRLAFLRALYQVKPLICALPAGTWVG